MLINGEKYACEACVRGHRVSNCHHADRPLQHINKKGRPVSQCQHCRSMRKSRAAHVKCDCGEKTHKCTHLNNKTAAEGNHADSCCCNHGGRCTCSHKKEIHLDPVPESSDSDKEGSISTTPSRSSKISLRNRRRANTSDSILVFDENGHHKPIHKHVKPSQKCSPYQLNRVHSMHGTGSMANRSMDDLLHGSGVGEKASPAGGCDNIEQRKTKSEAASPLMTGLSMTASNDQIQPLDLSGMEYSAYVPNSFDFFSSLSDQELPMYSAGLNPPPVDWSHYDGLDFGSKAPESFAPSSYSQPASFGGFEFNDFNEPPNMTSTTTTTSMSGELSELDDFLPGGFEDFETLATNLRNNAANNGFSNLTASQSSLPGGAGISGLDFGTFNPIKDSAKVFPTPTSISGDDVVLTAATNAGLPLVDDESAIWMAEYCHGLPSLTESSDSGLPPFWEIS